MDKRPPGRPRLPLDQLLTTVTTSLTRKEAEQLDVMANEKGVTRPVLLREIVRKALNKK